MSKWITGRELIKRWDIKDFELFDFLKQGLQPYTRYGKRIVNSDTLKRARRDSIEKIERDLRTKQNAKTLSSGGFWKKTESQIKSEAQRIYDEQRLEIVNPPVDCMLMSFSIPLDENKAAIVTSRVMGFWFKMDDILEFEREHPEIMRQATTNDIKKSESLGLRDVTMNKKKRKLRPAQLHKIAARKIAEEIWKENPSITIADMMNRQEIINACENTIYMEKTLRDWIKDLCPNRSPGRRIKAK